MNVNDIEFKVDISGEGSPLIWGHGLMGSMAVEDAAGWFKWERMREVARVIRYDARGHGESQASYDPVDYRWDNLAVDMNAIADKAEAGPRIAGGQSMGCATAIYAALADPDNVTGLVLMNPPTAWETRAEQAGMYKRMARVGRLLGGGLLARLTSRNPERLLPVWLLEAQADRTEAYLDGIRKMDGKTLSVVLRGAGLCDLPTREELRALTMPAIILAWEGDQSHPVRTAEELHNLMPGSTLNIARDIYDFKTWPGLVREFVRKCSG